MAAKRLTEIMIEKAKPAAPPADRYEIFDAVLPGFGVRVTKEGTKSFFLMYRFAGKQRRLTFGRHPRVGLKKAREDAGVALDKLEHGIDPAAPAASEAPPPIVRDVLETYFARRIRPRLRGAAEVERAFGKSFLPALGDRTIASVTRTDIHGMLDAIVDRGAPVHANRMLTLAKTFFAWALERGYISQSPAAAVSPPTREVSRERVLEQHELVRIWRACDTLGEPFGPIVRLLILTAQRRDEVGGMRWAEIDADKGLWTIPPERAKNGRAHEVPLAPKAAAIIEALSRGASPFLFTKTGITAVSGWSKAKVRLDRALMAPGELIGPPAPMEPWTLHDLRRSAATAMAELGAAPHVVDKLLNHVQGTIRGVAAIYNRHEYMSERRRALEAWERRLVGLIEGRTGTLVEFQAVTTS